MNIHCLNCRKPVEYQVRDVKLEFKQICHMDKKSNAEVCEDMIVGAFIVCPFCGKSISLNPQRQGEKHD